MYQININMKQMYKWKVYQDNVTWFENIIIRKGKIITINAQPYIEWLNEFNIFYTMG